MPTWTPAQLLEYENRRSSSRAKPEQVIRNEPMAKKARKEPDTNRVRVCVTSYRRRLCDADNLCPKYFIDCLRYAEIIKDDAPKFITLQTSQVKVATAREERTEITIEQI